jgi:hypothetical protein
MSSKDIASQLLQSSDTRIAEAAKRVFSDGASSSLLSFYSSSSSPAITTTAQQNENGGRTENSLGREEEETENEEDGKLSSTDRLKRRLVDFYCVSCCVYYRNWFC